jgi:DNA-binding transcriptional LysR family regulator
VSSLQGAPRGLLRVTAGTNAGWLGSIVGDFLKRYPEVRVELVCTGRVVDLIEERFDLGIRAGALTDSTLIARSLGVGRWFLATPAYLERRGHPKSPADLEKHDCLLFGSGASGSVLRLENGDRSVQLSVSSRMLVNDMDVLREPRAPASGSRCYPRISASTDCALARWSAFCRTGTCRPRRCTWCIPPRVMSLRR